MTATPRPQQVHSEGELLSNENSNLPTNNQHNQEDASLGDKTKAYSQPETPTKNAILKNKRARALFQLDREAASEEKGEAHQKEEEADLTGMLLMQPKPIRMHVLQMLLGMPIIPLISSV